MDKYGMKSNCFCKKFALYKRQRQAKDLSCVTLINLCNSILNVSLIQKTSKSLLTIWEKDKNFSDGQ